MLYVQSLGLVPMTKTVLLGTTFAAIFAIAMISSASASDPWLGVDNSVINQKGKNVQLLIDATGDIPKNAGEGVLAGFGWFYADGPDAVFAVTTHNPVRDSHQNPDKWHVHNVAVSDSINTEIADACIASLSGYVQAGISIKGEIMQINTNQNSLSGTLSDGAGAFHIVNDASACPIQTVLANGNDSGLNLGVKFQ